MKPAGTSLLGIYLNDHLAGATAGTELATDALWAASSPAFERSGARAGLALAGVANGGMALGFGWLSERGRKARKGG